MRKALITLLLLVGGAVLASQAFGDVLLNAKTSKARLAKVPHLNRLGTSATSVDPETVWVGHVSSGATYDYGPNHIGRGPNMPTINPPAIPGDFGTPPNVTNVSDWNGIFSWDLYQLGENDSLMGFYPLKVLNWENRGLELADYKRCWWALDYGNTLNYRSSATRDLAGTVRTPGVTGLWHRDDGSNSGGGSLITWAPWQGTYAAWCGLGHSEDQTRPKDEVANGGTGNPYNGLITQLSYFSAALFDGNDASETNFPGYPGQIDQMLYRDINNPPNGTDITITFDYVTNMSTAVDPAFSQAGWFDKDPIKIPDLTGVTDDRNFISATKAAGNAPRDSFMVYVGVPVNDASCTYTGGSPNPRPVYDPLRRWLSEVIRIKTVAGVVSLDNGYEMDINDIGGPQAEAAAWGVKGTPGDPINVDGTDVPSLVIPGATVTAMKAAGNGNIRLVFRVKTNNYGDDGDNGISAFSSGSVGAAIIDNVVVSGTGGFSVNFEGSADINNTTSATNAFHTTGKPPFSQGHLHKLQTGSGLVYQDLCGAPYSPARLCNIYRNVASIGDHDNAEASGGTFGSGEEGQVQGILSPTINLMNGGSGVYNGMGIDEDIASRAELNLWSDIYFGRMNLVITGDSQVFGAQAYPDVQANGKNCWGPIQFPGYSFFNPDPQCFNDIEEMYSNGLVIWSGASQSAAHPDSVRVWTGAIQSCFRFSLPAANCTNSDGEYHDNLSIGFNNTGPSGGGGNPIAQDIWNWLNDAFPFNDSFNPDLVGADFDTTTILIKTGRNNAPLTGITRPSVPNDTSVVNGQVAGGARLDMIFRVYPGPGNYHTIGNVNSGLRLAPTDPVGVASPSASATDFWSNYMADPGSFASPGAVGLHAASPSGWDVNVWNSARCDSVERNLGIPTLVRSQAVGKGVWRNTYYDADSHLPELGKTRNKCFVIDLTKSFTNSNVTCSTVPAYVTAAGTGYDGSQTTIEGTKILPDGFFTPGTHIEYFYRLARVSDGVQTAIGPDTNVVFLQLAEGSIDGHRWQEISALPDRWKDYGLGRACILVFDHNDRRGNERAWKGVADSIGATASSDYGKHDGWHAIGGGADIDDPTMNIDPTTGTANFRAQHGGQAGTIWDMYGQKASESLSTTAGSFSSRGAAAAVGDMAGQDNKIGITAKMADLYKLVIELAGDSPNPVGPFANRSEDEVTIIETFLGDGTPADKHGWWASGDTYAQTEQGLHPAHLAAYFGVTLYSPSYVNISGSLNEYADLITAAPLAAPAPPGYSAGNNCSWGNDVLNVNTAVVTASAIMDYEPTVGGVGPPPYHSSVMNAAADYTTLLDGFEIEHIFTRFGSGSWGRRDYYLNALTNVFSGFCTLVGSPVGVGDNPRTVQGVDFLRMTSSNPYRSGTATLEFGVAKAGKVEVGIYDVAGRQIRVLANQLFQPGRYKLTWDGVDGSGNTVSRGVYFYRLKSPFFTTANKMIVLK